jgi:hypothetical protein
MAKQNKIEKVTFKSGATRSKIKPARYDLITPIGLRRVAETYAEGAEIHGERNWENGLPIDDCINRAIRHIYLYLSKDTSEDHIAHAAWNLLATMHFEEKQLCDKGMIQTSSCPEKIDPDASGKANACKKNKVC